MTESLSVLLVERTRRAAIFVDLAAVGVTGFANVADAPRSVSGVVLAAAAPGFLGLAVVLWHRAHGVLSGWSGRLFMAGLGVIAAMCFAVSFTHIRDLALDSGQSPLAAALLPLVIDGTAVLSSVVVLACGRILELVRAADAQAEADARKARRDAEDEARRLAEVERAATERVLAEAEAEERRIRAEGEAEARVMAERRAAAESIVKARKKTGGKADVVDLETTVAAVLAARAGERGGKGPLLATVAREVGVSERHVQRTSAWRGRNKTTGEAGPVDAGVLDVVSGENGNHRVEEMRV